LATLATENEQMATEWVGTYHLLRLRSQTIEPIAQVNRAAGEENLRASRQADHSAPRMARRTRDSAFSLTKPATQMRTPFGNAISIVPASPALA
jgi:hypothetical protein